MGEKGKSRWKRRKTYYPPSPTNTKKKKKTKQKKKPTKIVEQFPQNLYWMLAEDPKPPKRARNPLCNCVEWKEKKLEAGGKKKESEWRQHSWEGAVKEGRNPNPGNPPNWQGDQPRQMIMKTQPPVLFITIQAFLKKRRKKNQINNLNYHLKEWEKKQIKPKVRRKKEIIKIREEINKIEI